MADHSQAASYIHTVQHLIEECILFNMSKQECMDALSKHANIQPLITSTVWDGLVKENKEFFQGYAKTIEAKKATRGKGEGEDGSGSESSSSTQNGGVSSITDIL